MKGLAVYVVAITLIILIVPCVAILADINISLHAMIVQPIIAVFYLILAGAALSRRFNASMAIIVWDILSMLVLLSGAGYVLLTQGTEPAYGRYDAWWNSAHWAIVTLVYYIPLLILSIAVIVHAGKRNVARKEDKPEITAAKLN